MLGDGIGARGKVPAALGAISRTSAGRWWRYGTQSYTVPYRADGNVPKNEKTLAETYTNARSSVF